MSQKLATKITAALEARALPFVAVYEPAEDESVDSEIAIKRDGKPVPFSLQLDAHGSVLNRYFGEAFGGAAGERTGVQSLAMFVRGEDAKAIKRLVSELADYHAAQVAPAKAEPVIAAVAAKALYLSATEWGSAAELAAWDALFVRIEPLLPADIFAPYVKAKMSPVDMIRAAYRHAGVTVSPTDMLTAEYEVYCAAQGLPAASADELLANLQERDAGTPEQRAWLSAFIDRWEAARNCSTCLGEGYLSSGNECQTCHGAGKPPAVEAEPYTPICMDCGERDASTEDVLCAVCRAQASQEDPEVECPNCEWTGPESACRPISDIEQRVSPGESMPSGECPECGALCHEIEVSLPAGPRDLITSQFVAWRTAQGFTTTPEQLAFLRTAERGMPIAEPVGAATPAPAMVTVRELGTVIAALRNWQYNRGVNRTRYYADIETNGGTVAPLTVEEIDALCNRLTAKG